jgi:Acetyltransferase (GNAT) family
MSEKAIKQIGVHNMLSENILLDTTITIVDKDIGEKLGQLRYITRDSEVEIFDAYIFPEHRRKKMMSGILKKIVPELKVSGISKISLKYFNDDACIAWEKMGFVKVGENGRMELDL